MVTDFDRNPLWVSLYMQLLVGLHGEGALEFWKQPTRGTHCACGALALPVQLSCRPIGSSGERPAPAFCPVSSKVEQGKLVWKDTATCGSAILYQPSWRRATPCLGLEPLVVYCEGPERSFVVLRCLLQRQEHAPAACISALQACICLCFTSLPLLLGDMVRGLCITLWVASAYKTHSTAMSRKSPFAVLATLATHSHLRPRPKSTGGRN